MGFKSRYVPLMLCLLLVSIDPAFAAAEGSGWGWLETIGRWVNLIILFGGIYLVIRKPAAHFFEERRSAIRKEMEEARKARDAAEEKLASITGRLENLDDELAQIRAQAEKEAQLDRERIIQEAERESLKAVAYAQAEIDGMSRAARKELRRYAAELAVELAEERIRGGLDENRENRLVERFFEGLKKEVRE